MNHGYYKHWPNKGYYIKDLLEAQSLGKKYIDSVVLKKVRKPTVVWDLDDTLVFVNYNNNVLDNKKNTTLNKMNYKSTKRDDPGYFYKPNKPMVNLCKYFKKKGVTNIIVTNRDPYYKRWTAKNVKKYNIPIDELYTRRKPDDTVPSFKNAIKKDLEKNGYTILLTVGDQYTDLNRPRSYEATLKLPDTVDKKIRFKKPKDKKFCLKSY